VLCLKSLIYNNIGRFTEEQRIDFDKHENLLLIDGVSGVGKSTIFHALDYLLGINAIPATQLQCRFTTKPIIVRGIFSYNGKDIEIERGKKTGLTINLGADIISGNVEIAEAKLDELIGMPRKLFQKMIHKPQRDFGFFLQMTSKQMYEFLIEVLGLKKYQDCIEVIAEQIKEFNKNIETSQITIKNMGSAYQDLLAMQAPVMPEKPPITLDMVNTLKSTKTTLELEIKTLEDAYARELNKIPMPSKVEMKMDNIVLLSYIDKLNQVEESKQSEVQIIVQQRKDLSGEIQSINNQLGQIQHSKLECKDIGTKINALKLQKQQAESSVCPTCQQSWQNIDRQAYIQDIEDSIQELLQKALDRKSLILQEPELTKALEECHIKLESLQIPDTSTIDTEIELLKKKINTEKDRINNTLHQIEMDYLQKQNDYLKECDEIKKNHSIKKEEISSKIRELHIQITTGEQALMNYQANYDFYCQRKKEMDILMDRKKKELTQLSTSLQNMQQEVLIAEETKRAIKLYTLQIFQETLDTIGENASAILGSVHNMVNSSIYFEGCKETKSGSIKDEVNAIITKEGDTDVPIKTLSGGERTVVDLAVDLAVIDIIEDKVGKGANFFIIDEPFDGLDTDGKEQYLEIIKNLNSNKQIILVDHSPELKEMISDVIKIDK